MDATYIEPPETPAPVFAVRAFKHAIFGTPHQTEPVTVKPVRQSDKPSTARRSLDKQDAHDQDALRGIMSTPGTAKGRKTVSFGAHVVDNEGRKSTFAKSGLPTNYPGKFPSPWTPKNPTDALPETRPGSSSKLTEKLYQVRESTKAEESKKELSRPKPRAKDDGDITIDVMEPRSESGRYWKEQFQSYTERSEKEVKKLITKQQLAKNYAKKKDAEATELAEKLETERKQHRQRERELEENNKDYKEQLREAMAEIAKLRAETGTSKQRLAGHEGSKTGSAKSAGSSSASKALPETRAANAYDDFERGVASLQCIQHEGTPVANRRRTSRAKDGASPRKLGRSAADVRTDKGNAAGSQSKAANEPAIDDTWMIDDPPATVNATASASSSRGAKTGNVSAETNARVPASRAKTDRSLQPQANVRDSAAISTVPNSLSTEADRKRLAMERVQAKRREREKDKENAKTNPVFLP
ncbi:uncharacterized protein K452DRAFT_357997 [Aplosporella prunicola CBS 121167]|uniref:Spindle pole body-associated protein cut12 domain-containing protein n=1 Tax=Aplosporella prunicola CBS 121167 TaxID=1176127 RepID=A0A6A6BJF7_9PEZI|nr:uncharacterized protein K452DRAFT_357997 [Aplosporella prunicola CBS 121167]KAF2142947.1 hypothetical protein K452DRAFT_357997 [Aplosporella prunicola CBS 121167]